MKCQTSKEDLKENQAESTWTNGPDKRNFSLDSSENSQHQLKVSKSKHGTNNKIITSILKQSKTRKSFLNTNVAIKRAKPFLVSIKEIRILLMLFLINVSFVFSYLPSILSSRNIIQDQNIYLFYLYLANSATNPIIYLIMMKSYRSDLQKMFRKITSKSFF